MRTDARGRSVFSSEARALQALALAAAVSATACASVESPAPPTHVEPVETAKPSSPAPHAPSLATTASAEPKPEERRVVISESVGMIILQKVQFAPQNAVPSPESRAILDETAKVLLENPDLIPLLRVEGHADTRERQPEAIAKRRAAEVVDYLIAKGVPPDRLVADGEGAEKPIADNATAEGRAKNRRIEFHVVR